MTTETKVDYESTCCICGQPGVIDIYENGEFVQSTNMCGPCTWGEADSLGDF